MSESNSDSSMFKELIWLVIFVCVCAFIFGGEPDVWDVVARERQAWIDQHATQAQPTEGAKP